MLINAHISILISNYFHSCMNISLSWSSWYTWFFSLSFCSTIVFIQLSSSISQVHLHRYLQNTVTSHCGTVYCITANLVMSIFSLFSVCSLLLTHWHITIFYCALSSLVSVNNEILVTGFHVLWLQC